MKRDRKESRRAAWIASAAMLLFIALVGGWFFYRVSTENVAGGRKVFIAKVDLVRPSSIPDRLPPTPKEKPPEPDVRKEQTVPPPMDVPPDASPREAPGPKGDEKPAAQGPLGLEGEGTAGADAFGLAGRGKGGRDAYTVGTGLGRGGGGADQAALQRRFGWYTRIVGDELNKLVRRYMEEHGGPPKGSLEVEVLIELDEQGVVKRYRIIRSSGNQAMDDAVRALKSARISRPLPKGIYSGMNYKITSR